MADQSKRTLKPIEQCPDGHFYNSEKTGTKCGVCGKELDPLEPEEMTPEELAEQIYLDEQNWVCGWLVCISGVNKGHDYKVRAGKNFIGSASSMDVQVIGDKRIEKYNHAVITYDAKARTTILTTGDSHGIVYLKGQAVWEPKPIKAFDKIALGESIFMYVTFCGEDFDWNDQDDKATSQG